MDREIAAVQAALASLDEEEREGQDDEAREGPKDEDAWSTSDSDREDAGSERAGQAGASRSEAGPAAAEGEAGETPPAGREEAWHEAEGGQGYWQ